MSHQPKRVVMIGLDGAEYEGIKPLLARGELPHLQRLLEAGTRCENAYSPYPTLTGSIWASIATGAWPGTHGVTDMSYHVTGEPLDAWHSGFTSDAVEAQTLWEALAERGKKSIVVNYPGGMPLRREDVVMVDGGGGRPFWGGSFIEISHSQLFSTEEIPNGNLIKTRPARGWSSLPVSGTPPLEFELTYRPQSGRVPEFLRFEDESVRTGDALAMWGLVFESDGQGYDTVALCREKDLAEPWVILREGERSDPAEHTFRSNGRRERGAVTILLEHLDAQTGALRLYSPQVYPIDGFTHPTELGEELVRRFGPYIHHTGYGEVGMGWFEHGVETWLPLVEYQNEWLGRASRFLMETEEWDLFVVQAHCLDWANHAFLPRHGWSDDEIEANRRHFDRLWRSTDRMIGEVLAGAPDDALVCVVSDHGGTASPCPEVFLDPILEQAGLLTYETSTDQAVRPRVDYSKTVAKTERSGFVYVNLAGRDPDGIVLPEDYEAARDRAIETLRSYREPTTGRNPFSMVLRKEDARILGLYDSMGRDIGDVVYALLPEFDHEHGRQLPGATNGGHTMKPLLVFHGPGVKSGHVLERTAWLVDVVPTICHMMGWPIPSEAEGAVLYQMLHDHATSFPRAGFLERQEERKREILSRHHKAVTEKTPVLAGAKKSVGAPVGADEDGGDVVLPDTVEGLKDALDSARREAAKWKDAYHQYHRITHGN